MSASDLLVLLPPSEGKRPGGRHRWSPTDGRYDALAPARRRVAESLVEAASHPDAGRLLGLAGAPLDAALAANRMLGDATALPAYQRYAGVVYQHLDYATLPAGTKRRAQRCVLVASGLLGLSALGDPVPDYRVAMTATLPGLGRVGAHWRTTLRHALSDEEPATVVVDLLSSDYSAVIDPAWLGRRVYTVRFERLTTGPEGPVRRVVSYDSKAAKGLLTRHLLQQRGSVAAGLASFCDLGWRLESPLPPRGKGGTLLYVRET